MAAEAAGPLLPAVSRPVPVDFSSPLRAFAPAKVNLTLRVLGRRADGYHELESLVMFADVGDVLALTACDGLSLTVDGPTAEATGSMADNLVLKAAQALAARVDGLRLGHFHLDKHLPVAAGIGGGSSDAAAALRLLALLNGLSLTDLRLQAAAAATGADVPVCLDPHPRVMRGIGDRLSDPIACTPFPAVLVNPRVAVPTRDVFRLLAAPELGAEPAADAPSADPVAGAVTGVNDLEAPARQLQPVIGEVLAALAALPGSRLTRMSGSGATCFALFSDQTAADAGAETLRALRPQWWVQATRLGTGHHRVG